MLRGDPAGRALPPGLGRPGQIASLRRNNRARSGRRASRSGRADDIPGVPGRIARNTRAWVSRLRRGRERSPDGPVPVCTGALRHPYARHRRCIHDLSAIGIDETFCRNRAKVRHAGYRSLPRHQGPQRRCRRSAHGRVVLVRRREAQAAQRLALAPPGHAHCQSVHEALDRMHWSVKRSP
jgi:hypothetical protein